MSHTPTKADVEHFLSIPRKLVIRRPVWAKKPGRHSPPFVMFESTIFLNGQPMDGFRFMAVYRGPRLMRSGSASAWLPEKTAVSILFRGCRIAAMDSDPLQAHPNPVIDGWKFSGQEVVAETHRHVWTNEHLDRYVEPVDPPILDAVELLNTFAQECNLLFTSSVPHPRRGEQGELL